MAEIVDVAPQIAELVQVEFERQLNDNKEIAQILARIEKGTATYEDANEYAILVGEMLEGAFSKITSDMLPDGKMYYNIAEKIIAPQLKRIHNLVAGVAEQIQQSLNYQAGLGLKALIPDVNNDRVDSFVRKVSKHEKFEEIAWMLQDPVVNFAQSVVDSSVQKNIYFHHEVGLNPKITRIVMGGCCAWCRSLAGTYDYEHLPEDIYKRHRFCRCMVLYDPGNGRKQNVHTKEWTENPEDLLRRKVVGLTCNGVTIQNISIHFSDRLAERNVRISDVVDAIINPLKIDPTKIDNMGRPSFGVIGRTATITINPSTGILLTAHKTHSKLAAKLMGER